MMSQAIADGLEVKDGQADIRCLHAIVNDIFYAKWLGNVQNPRR